MTARVLIISYYFAPDGGPGTQRALKFAKYLWRYGWSTTVLTRETPDRRGRWDPEDRTLLREILSNVRVHRVDAPERASSWAKALPVLDQPRTHAWVEAAYEKANKLIELELIDLVFITMSPFDLVHLGRRLQTQGKVPVVYDLRDPWALDGWRVHRNRGQWQRDHDFMQLMLSQADGVIANTPQASQAFSRDTPTLQTTRLRTIPNGYDENDFDRTPLGAYQRDPTEFRLVHTGSLHAQRLENYKGVLGAVKKRVHYSPESIEPSGRSLLHLLEALRRLQRQRHPLAGIMKLILAGLPDDATRRQVKAAGLDKIVQWTGYLPHHESVSLVQKADALFLPLHDVPPGQCSLIVPGKTYEYLASGRPVLACVPNGDARDLVQASPNGYCAAPCDAIDIARVLTTIHESWGEGRHDVSMLPTWMARYERRQLAAQLAEFFDRLIGRSQVPRCLPQAA